ncbi:putative transcriptional regulator [Frankia sp. Allo2]|uniref:helix-turn-helix domain-containing protein n=1 Tax=Frankia sp. Allo2 TaxID=981405 RepID=UPI0004DCF91E|nr:helix-turn-helix domain-containing protein [Frankia sp. Allo2]KFB05541.1 putative transcriptional regulator [Frankia sp. Allo2]
MFQIFEALANPPWCDLIERLHVGLAPLGELAEWCKADVQTVCKHIEVLEQAGLVSRTGDAHRSLVRLNAEVFDLITTRIVDGFRPEHWGIAPDRAQLMGIIVKNPGRAHRIVHR